MVLELPYLGVLPCYYHDHFYRFFLKFVVENGNRRKNGGVKKEVCMVEKNGSIFYFWSWNVTKWYTMVVKMLDFEKIKKNYIFF